MSEAIRNGLRLEAIAADIAGGGDTAPELLRVNTYATVPGVGYRIDAGADDEEVNHG